MSPRVLFTASTASHILNFHLPYINRFRELGCQVDVACGGGGDIPGCHRVIPLPFQKKITAPKNFRAVSLLRRQFRETPYDLVIVHTALAAYFTRLALPKKGRPPVVNMVHGYLFKEDDPGFKDKLLLKAEKMTAERTDLLLTMNQRDLETARAHRLGREIGFVPGVGVDFTRLDPALRRDRAALRRELGLPEEGFLLLYAAEFSGRKNQALLIRAMGALPEKAVLVLPGQGELWAECKALAGSLGVADRVLFPGQVKDMGPWYAAADAAVSSSRSEGLPFNIMEAMYASLPVAATAVKGHTDLIRDGETGLLFPPEDPAACGAAIRRLLEDPGLGRALGEAAHTAAAPYSLPLVLPQVMERYLSLLPLPTPV